MLNGETDSFPCYDGEVVRWRRDFIEELTRVGNIFAENALSFLRDAKERGDLAGMLKAVQEWNIPQFTRDGPFFSEYAQIIDWIVRQLDASSSEKATKFLLRLRRDRVRQARPRLKESPAKRVERLGLFLPPIFDFDELLLSRLTGQRFERIRDETISETQRLKRDEWPPLTVYEKETRPMDAALFWEIIEKTARDPDSRELDIDDLRQRLAACGTARIAKWQKLLRGSMQKLYRSDVWGVGYAMQGGLGEDSFEYFLAWIVSQGESTFKHFCQSPANAALDIPAGISFDAEEMLYVAEDACSLLGKELSESTKQIDIVPRGFKLPWSESEIPAIYPEIWSRFHPS